MTTQTALKQSRVTHFSQVEQLPDPPRRCDMWQDEIVAYFHSILRPYFAGQDDVLVGGGGYLIRNAGDVGEFYPDGLVARGVSDPQGIIWRNGYVISEVGKPPDFVLEVASRSTGRRDYTVKREGYARYGVGEYWRFDPTGGRYHDAPIAGDRLVGGVYEPLEIVNEPDGRHWGYSEALGLELWWDNKELRFRDPVSGEFLPTPEELGAALESERAARDSADARANAADARADAEQAARESAEARVAEMEAELRRLGDERRES